MLGYHDSDVNRVARVLQQAVTKGAQRLRIFPAEKGTIQIEYEIDGKKVAGEAPERRFYVEFFGTLWLFSRAAHSLARIGIFSSLIYTFGIGWSLTFDPGQGRQELLSDIYVVATKVNAGLCELETNE